MSGQLWFMFSDCHRGIMALCMRSALKSRWYVLSLHDFSSSSLLERYLLSPEWNQQISGGSRVKNHLTVAAPLVFNHFECQHDKPVVTLKAILCLALCCKTHQNHWESFNWIEHLWTGNIRTKSASGPAVRVSSPWQAQRAGGGPARGSAQPEFSVSCCFLGTHAVSIVLQPACQEVTWLLSREGAHSLARKDYWHKLRQIPWLFKRFFGIFLDNLAAGSQMYILSKAWYFYWCLFFTCICYSFTYMKMSPSTGFLCK